MRLRLLSILLVIVLAPLVFLGGLTWRSIGDEERMAQVRFTELVEGRLLDLSGNVGQNTSQLERRFDRALDNVEREPSALRTLRREEPLIREIFWLGPDGRMRFPPTDASRSKEEQAFVQRTAAIWDRKAILYDPPKADTARLARSEQPARKKGRASRSSSARSTGGDSVVQLAARRRSGWISWYWQEGLHLLYWRRLAQGGVLGVEVERVALLSRVVGGLPSTPLAGARMVLTDSRNDTLYQWGELSGPQQAPVATIALNYPLDSWHLAYFASADHQARFFSRSIRLYLFLGLGAFALALLGLTVYLYREFSRDMREAAQRVNFVTQVSHELKTPLTNIRLYAELIESDLDEEEERTARRLSVIVSESERLTRLINNILSFSKHRRGQLELSRAPTALDPLIAQVLKQFEPALESKGVQTEVELNAPRPARVDPDAIGQILANLMSNIEKYGYSGGRAIVHSRQEGARTVITVQDRGPGVPDDQRERVFSPFVRLSDRLQDGVTGTGLGLTIARELARLHGGDLQLRAGPGARFELVLVDEEESHEGTDR